MSVRDSPGYLPYPEISILASTSTDTCISTLKANQSIQTTLRCFPGNETASSSDHGDILAVQPLSTTVVLILALTIGCFFFFVALVIVGKRLFDGWKKRHYSRIERDYLIDGMYSE